VINEWPTSGRDKNGITFLILILLIVMQRTGAISNNCRSLVFTPFCYLYEYLCVVMDFIIIVIHFVLIVGIII
jgi:hypothetical protein